MEVTSETLTGRGGLAFFGRYVRGTGIDQSLERLFGLMRKSGKGVPVRAVFHQHFCILVDGTSRHLVSFDGPDQGEGYARAIETEPARMAASHAVKCFFTAFGWGRIWLFRKLLRRLFLWWLEQVQAAVVVLSLDPMIMDNDEAVVRQGCQPTYKKVMGFRPLQLI